MGKNAVGEKMLDRKYHDPVFSSGNPSKAKCKGNQKQKIFILSNFFFKKKEVQVKNQHKVRKLCVHCRKSVSLRFARKNPGRSLKIAGNIQDGFSLRKFPQQFSPFKPPPPGIWGQLGCTHTPLSHSLGARALPAVGKGRRPPPAPPPAGSTPRGGPGGRATPVALEVSFPSGLLRLRAHVPDQLPSLL